MVATRHKRKRHHFVELSAFTVTESGTGTLPVDSSGSQAGSLCHIPPGEYLAPLTHPGSRGTGVQASDFYSKCAMARHAAWPKELKRLARLSLDDAEGQEFRAYMNWMGRYAAARRFSRCSATSWHLAARKITRRHFIQAASLAIVHHRTRAVAAELSLIESIGKPVLPAPRLEKGAWFRSAEEGKLIWHRLVLRFARDAYALAYGAGWGRIFATSAAQSEAIFAELHAVLGEAPKPEVPAFYMLRHDGNDFAADAILRPSSGPHKRERRSIGFAPAYGAM
ncbi:MAG: hypothetical protein ABMA01_02410 [Chthoniobacteraceae bacterium]